MTVSRSRPLTVVTAVLVAMSALITPAVADESIRPVEAAASVRSCTDRQMGDEPGWTLSTTTFDPAFVNHPFVGNGYLSQRVPPAGMGYVGTGEPTGFPLKTPRYDGAFVAGLYGAQDDLASGRHVDAAIPTWSTLTVGVGSEVFTPSSPTSEISNYRQTLFLRCGLLRTSLTWTTADGRATDLQYDVLADRADAHVGTVRLHMTPHWSGQANATDVLDGAGARRLAPRATQQHAGEDTITVPFTAQKTGITGAVVSTLRVDDESRLTARNRTRRGDGLTAGQSISLDVHSGHQYEFTKFVGVDTSLTSQTPDASAASASHLASQRGWGAVFSEHSAAWRDLWRSDISIPGNADLQSSMRQGRYGLLSSIRSGQDNSIAPAGLSSDNYAGLVFWDAETWMYPSLLLQNPDLAKSIIAYREKTLPAARENARQVGQQGLFFPWTSADTGALQSDCHSWKPVNAPHCHTQNHLQSDIALAVWQYYQATGDLGWLREHGWPLLEGIAQYWSGRVARNDDGSYSIHNVSGPDEYSNGVTDGVYTNAGAATTLRNATQAARLLGEGAPAQWTTIADHLRIPFDQKQQVFQQYDGYAGGVVKQADSVLLQYPLEWPMSPQAASNTLDFYTSRTDPDGPAMTDAVHAIDAAATGQPGCVTNTYLQRSVKPFVRGPFQQFSEARGTHAGSDGGAPAYNFLTGVGGLAQEFTNGLTGLRLRTDRVHVDPMLPPQLAPGVTITGLHWQGRVFDITVGAQNTILTLRQGPSMRVEAPDGEHVVSAGLPVALKTRRPDLEPTDNLARCRTATAGSEEPGMYADAAVDGNAVTGWSPASRDSALTVDLGDAKSIGAVSIQWGSVKPANCQVETSFDGQHFSPAPPADPAGRLARAVRARYVRLDVTGPAGDQRVRLQELAVRG
jgi:trehalose/maltose hydrolase-like predicted phosphorylase